jgi:hypothetical protein
LPNVLTEHERRVVWWMWGKRKGDIAILCSALIQDHNFYLSYYTAGYSFNNEKINLTKGQRVLQ